MKFLFGKISGKAGSASRGHSLSHLILQRLTEIPKHIKHSLKCLSDVRILDNRGNHRLPQGRQRNSPP